MKTFKIVTIIFFIAFIAIGCGKNPMFSLLPAVANDAGNGNGGSGGGVTNTIRTAKWAYDKAKPLAMAWASDSRFVGINGTMNADGTANWNINFASTSKNQSYKVVV